MKVGGRNLRAVWFEGPAKGGAVAMIDQRRLPHEVAIVRARTVTDVAVLIRDMAVRGAPTIGATAAYGMVLGAEDPQEAARVLAASRPTARDLFTAIETMRADPGLDRAEAYVSSIVERCRRIGEIGATALVAHARNDGEVRVLTHCHAGALATVDHGSALAPFHHLAALGSDAPVRPFVWVDETRPRLQGAITAWELGEAGVPHRVVVDSAAGALMARGDVDAVIVGADRIAANGDLANKIGTYTKAVLARENGIPFYVAAPASTFDMDLPDGTGIAIEERAPEEVLEARGARLFAPGTVVANPAFDVTPARFVSGYITEVGVLRPDRFAALWPVAGA